MNKPINLKKLNYPSDHLDNKKILITGAGDGIGKAVAISFAQHGAQIILLGKTLKKLHATHDEIVQQGGKSPIIYTINLKDATINDYLQMARQIKIKLGGLDGIIHNAACLKLLCSIQDYDIKTWYEVMQVNLHAPFLMTQAFLPLLKQSKEATILFTGGSVKPSWGAYGVSKNAINGLMQTLAQELENTTIRVNSIHPNKTQTTLYSFVNPHIKEKNLRKPKNLAPYYLWLMGKDGRKTHGQTLTVEDK